MGFAAAEAGAVVEEDEGAGEAFEDRDCWGVREAEGRGLAHAPLGVMLENVYLVFALVCYIPWFVCHDCFCDLCVLKALEAEASRRRQSMWDGYAMYDLVS